MSSNSNVITCPHPGYPQKEIYWNRRTPSSLLTKNKTTYNLHKNYSGHGRVTDEDLIRVVKAVESKEFPTEFAESFPNVTARQLKTQPFLVDKFMQQFMKKTVKQQMPYEKTSAPPPDIYGGGKYATPQKTSATLPEPWQVADRELFMELLPIFRQMGGKKGVERYRDIVLKDNLLRKDIVAKYGGDPLIDDTVPMGLRKLLAEFQKKTGSKVSREDKEQEILSVTQ